MKPYHVRLWLASGFDASACPPVSVAPVFLHCPTPPLPPPWPHQSHRIPLFAAALNDPAMFLMQTTHLDPARFNESSGNLLKSYEDYLRHVVDVEVGTGRWSCEGKGRVGGGGR